MADMSKRITIATLSVSVAFLIPAVLSFAQVPQPPALAPFRITAIRQRLVSPPDFRSILQDTGNRSTGANQNWLQIEAEFASAPEWADDVQLKYYVLVGQGENARCLIGEMIYVNVAKGPQHYSGMFVHPNTLQRYGNGQVGAVAVQLFHRGLLVDQSSYPPADDHWWERMTPVTGLVLPPRETPWSVLAFGRYESPKPTP
jgi:hypothetical protein